MAVIAQDIATRVTRKQAPSAVQAKLVAQKLKLVSYLALDIIDAGELGQQTNSGL